MKRLWRDKRSSLLVRSAKEHFTMKVLVVNVIKPFYYINYGVEKTSVLSFTGWGENPRPFSLFSFIFSNFTAELQRGFKTFLIYTCWWGQSKHTITNLDLVIDIRF
jgi:hypothetical protein